MDKVKQSLERDYYTILGAPKTANFEELRVAFRRKALLLHPDRSRTDDAARQFIELHDAYRYLADPARRARYDRLFYELDKPKADTTENFGLARRKSEAGLRPHMTQDDPMRNAPREPAPKTATPPRQPVEETPRTPEYPNVDPYPARQRGIVPSPEEITSRIEDDKEVPMSPRKIPLPPSPTNRTASVPLPETGSRPASPEKRLHGRSTSAAPPPKRDWPGATTSLPADTADINIPPPQHMPPRRHRARSPSRSRAAPAKDETVFSSDTDVSLPVFYKPLRAFDPPAPLPKPTAWTYPLRLTLEELYTGCRKRFSITRSHLNGRLEEAIIDIDVQAGWKKGTRITYRGAGSEIEPGVFQDLVFVVRQLPDERFIREGPGGKDLLARYGLRLVDALTSGGKQGATVETVDRRRVSVRLPQGVIRDGDRAVLPGEGMPIRKGGQIIEKGDLIIEWVIIYPETLTQEQIDALRPILSPAGA